MNDKSQRSDSFKQLKEWLDDGDRAKYFDPDYRVDLARRDDTFRLWLDRGRFQGFLSYSGVTPSDIEKLECRFKFVIRYLAALIGASVITTWALTFAAGQDLFFWVALSGGLLGSATAAFISTLDRWANGLEDFHGNAHPDPKAKKERFNERFSSWLFYRPLLGVVAAVLIYFGADTLINKDSSWKPINREAYAFIGIVAGLFAKTLLEALLKSFKSLIGR